MFYLFTVVKHLCCSWIYDFAFSYFVYHYVKTTCDYIIKDWFRKFCTSEARFLQYVNNAGVTHPDLGTWQSTSQNGYVCLRPRIALPRKLRFLFRLQLIFFGSDRETKMPSLLIAVRYCDFSCKSIYKLFLEYKSHSISIFFEIVNAENCHIVRRMMMKGLVDYFVVFVLTWRLACRQLKW